MLIWPLSRVTSDPTHGEKCHIRALFPRWPNVSFYIISEAEQVVTVNVWIQNNRRADKQKALEMERTDGGEWIGINVSVGWTKCLTVRK